MRVVGQFPRRVKEIENQWIVLADGCRLAARIWLPVDAEDDPVPAILEYLPYRKRDGTAERDELTHPYFAGHGYAAVRVDIRGNGDSDGLMHDEYAPQEQDDALEVIDWIAAQPWCTGKVGMIGISWGGFNGLQVAARKPPALKAVVTICSTDDRYADDIHYKGGCLLNENLGWASTMLAFSSRPPDPALVGDRWREMWLERLENMPLLAETWLGHQRRDDYWKHGSVCEDFAAINAAVFAVGGWGDAYSNAIPRLLAGLTAPALGLTGPWIHKYPHFAVPEPRIGFLQECLRWWDHWLKGRDTGIMAEPLYRAYMMDGARPQGAYDERPGYWLAEPSWPSPNVAVRSLSLGPDGLGDAPAPDVALTVNSPADTGTAAGEYCAMWQGPEWPTDQRDDDARSLCFDTPPLDDRLEIFGAPVLSLEFSVDRPCAQVAVRLCDVWPDGASTRVTYGVRNLTHLNGHAAPAPLVPGERYRVDVRLDDIAYAFPPGHRVRLALSTAYWPQIWPSPAAATLTVHTGASRLDLPVRPPGQVAPLVFPEPEGAPPMAMEQIRPAVRSRTVERDLATGESVLRIDDDFGEKLIKAHGLAAAQSCREVYRIGPDDPLSAAAECRWTTELRRDGWRARTESRSTLTADAETFHIDAELEAFEGDERVFHKTWQRAVPRDFL